MIKTVLVLLHHCTIVIYQQPKSTKRAVIDIFFLFMVFPPSCAANTVFFYTHTWLTFHVNTFRYDA